MRLFLPFSFGYPLLSSSWFQTSFANVTAIEASLLLGSQLRYAAETSSQLRKAPMSHALAVDPRREILLAKTTSFA
jgi:hypothetical protein